MLPCQVQHRIPELMQAVQRADLEGMLAFFVDKDS